MTHNAFVSLSVKINTNSHFIKKFFTFYFYNIKAEIIQRNNFLTESQNNGNKELLKFQLFFNIYFSNAVSFMQQSSYKLMARVVIEKLQEICRRKKTGRKKGWHNNVDNVNNLRRIALKFSIKICSLTRV